MSLPFFVPVLYIAKGFTQQEKRAGIVTDEKGAEGEEAMSYGNETRLASSLKYLKLSFGCGRAGGQTNLGLWKRSHLIGRRLALMPAEIVGGRD